MYICCQSKRTGVETGGCSTNSQ